MATKAYDDWVADGSPWKDARPIRDVGDRLAEHGYTVYFHGDLRHLTNDPPEDHTPFSATGWPGKHPYPWCLAMDIMPPKDGQVSKLTGRPLPGLAALAVRLRSDVMNGSPGGAWVKYMNWEPGDGECWHDSWQPDYSRRASTDRGHIHVSGRSDMTGYEMAAGYDLVARTEGGGVPLWGWDASHYDATPNAAKVYSEGFRFMTHKAGGDANDAEIGSWWTAMKPYRDRMLLGAYWVQYPGNPAGRADAFLARLDSQCPGWRDGPFILQVDCEKWGGDSSTMPGKADIKAFCDRLVAKCPKLRPIVYAPKWAYGDSLSGLGYPLWASSYVTGSGAASALYPGDDSSRWGAYSGQTPAVLQFTSSATIAGQTTCDANAYRGTLDQLTALLAPGWADDMALTDADVDRMLARDKIGNPRQRADAATNPTTSWGFAVGDTWGRVYDLRDAVTALRATVDGYQKALMAAIANADDGAAVVAAVNASADKLVAEVRAAEQAEVDRDAANLAQLLAILNTIRSEATDPVTIEELEQALNTVYGSAFSRAKTADE